MFKKIFWLSTFGADRNNDRVSCKHVAVLELYTLDVTIADGYRSLVP